MGATKSIRWVVLLGCWILPSLVHAQTEDNDIADVRRKLTREAERLQARNYRPIGEPDIGAVRRDTPESVVFQLTANVTYAIVAACDPDCTHVIISLRDKRSQVLMLSLDKRDTVIVSGTPQESGEFTAEVAVPGCSEDECYAGMLLLSNQAARGVK